MINYLIVTTRGVLALNSDLEPTAIQPFDRDPKIVAEKYMQLESGNSIPELETILKQLAPTISSLLCMDSRVTELIAAQTPLPVSTITDMALSRKIRQSIPSILLTNGLAKAQQTFFIHLREVGMALAIGTLRRAGEERDRLVIQAVHAIDDINKMINLFATRIREWYGLHFPEADRLIEDHTYFLELVAHIGIRQNVLNASMSKNDKFPKHLMEELQKTAQDSVGADLSEADISTIQHLSKAALELYKRREELETYITTMMKEVAPNIQGLVGSLLGARLISLAGGLERLAKLPSSTIQLLGAERALFRSLRTNALPPKHGIIFQFPEIHQSPRWQRGKIARALAGKLAITARVDAFQGQYIADELRTNLLHSIGEIKKRFSKPPKRKKRRVTPRRKQKKRHTRKKKRR